MIDPKLNELPADATGTKDRKGSLSEKESAGGAKAGSRGLSINDTIAGDANLSVGSRGVDTSGVASGTGAGAGTATLTPGERGESPAPNIVPGARSSGTTPRGQYGSEEIPTTRLDTETEGPTPDEISERAYNCWHERGCPHGSPEVDWDRAEQELREERRGKRASGASA